MSYRTRFDRLVVSPPDGGETLTQAHFAPECDVNRMIQRFLMGDPGAIRNGRYGDFTNIPESLHDACNRLAAATSAWENLPESLRASYGSPEALLVALEHEEAARKSRKTFSQDALPGIDNSMPVNKPVDKTAGSNPAPVPTTT